MDDLSLPKDMAEAQQFLIELETKDQDKTRCAYPTCRKPRRPPPEGGGNTPAYCGNEEHTSLANSRLRANIKKLAQGLKAPKLETEQPVTPQMVQALEESVLAQMKRILHEFGLYVAAVEEVGDREITSAQIEAAHHRAAAIIASAQETVETERSLRLSAEHSRDTAQRDAQAARSEAELAIHKMQESEARAKRQ